MCRNVFSKFWITGFLGALVLLAAGTSGATERTQTAATHGAEFVAGAAPWVAHRVYDGIIYFLYSAPARIERYDVQGENWLSPVALSGTGSSFDVDASGIYVSESGGVEHFDLNGSAMPMLTAVPDGQSFLFLIGDYFFTATDYTFALRMKTTGTTVGAPGDYYTALHGFSGCIVDSRIFARTAGTSPSDIVTIPIDTAIPTMGDPIQSPYHGAFPGATETYANPAGGMAIDDSGTVYSADSLERLGSLGGTIQSIAYLSDRFVVLREGKLAEFDYNLRQTGEIDPPQGLVDLAVVDDAIYVLGTDGAMPTVTQLQPATFGVQPTPPARAWVDSSRWADHVIPDDGRILLVSANEHAVYPFDWTTWTFDQTVPLYIAPLHVAYSKVTRTVYASYAGGAIWSFTGQGQNPVWLASTAFDATGLATAGEYVFASDASGAWGSHWTFTPTGGLVSWIEWNHYSRQYEWDPVLRRMYFFRDGTSPNDLHWEEIAADGAIVDEGESPYHGDVAAQTPIRVSPDGSLIMIGSGQIFESAGLTFAGDLERSVADVAWAGGNLYAVAATPEPALFLRFSPTYAVTSAGRVRGTPRYIVPAGSNFLYVADVNNTTIVGVLDPFLSKADLAIDPYSPGAIFASGSSVTMDVVLGNNGSVPVDGAHVTGDLSMLMDATWQCVAEIGVAGCDGSTHNDPLDLTLDLNDGGQAHLHITGTVPYGATDRVTLPIAIDPAVPASDPELRNNETAIILRLNELFANGFD